MHDPEDCNEQVIELLVTQRLLYRKSISRECSNCFSSDDKLKACERCYDVFYCGRHVLCWLIFPYNVLILYFWKDFSSKRGLVAVIALPRNCHYFFFPNSSSHFELDDSTIVMKKSFVIRFQYSSSWWITEQLLLRECQKEHWNKEHKNHCKMRTQTDAVGQPFIISLPKSKLTYQNIVRNLESRCRLTLSCSSEHCKMSIKQSSVLLKPDEEIDLSKLLEKILQAFGECLSTSSGKQQQQ